MFLNGALQRFFRAQTATLLRFHLPGEDFLFFPEAGLDPRETRLRDAKAVLRLHGLLPEPVELDAQVVEGLRAFGRQKFRLVEFGQERLPLSLEGLSLDRRGGGLRAQAAFRLRRAGFERLEPHLQFLGGLSPFFQSRLGLLRLEPPDLQLLVFFRFGGFPLEGQGAELGIRFGRAPLGGFQFRSEGFELALARFFGGRNANDFPGGFLEFAPQRFDFRPGGDGVRAELSEVFEFPLQRSRPVFERFSFPFAAFKIAPGFFEPPFERFLLAPAFVDARVQLQIVIEHLVELGLAALQIELDLGGPFLFGFEGFTVVFGLLLQLPAQFLVHAKQLFGPRAQLEQERGVASAADDRFERAPGPEVELGAKHRVEGHARHHDDVAQGPRALRFPFDSNVIQHPLKDRGAPRRIYFSLLKIIE